MIRRVKSEIKPLANDIMQLLLTMMSNTSKSSTLLEDAFLTIGAMTVAVECQFVTYVESFLPMLISALQNHEEHAVMITIFDLLKDVLYSCWYHW